MLAWAAALVLGAGLPSAAQDPVMALCRPAWVVDGKASAAGFAFVLEQPRVSARPLIVTALHLVSRSVPVADLPQRARLESCTAMAGAVWPGAPAMAVEDAALRGPPFRDMAAFAPPQAGLTGAGVLQLAEQPPAIGDDVWVLAAMGGDAAPRKHRARVVHAALDALQYVFGDTTLPLADAAGAPVLNGDGRVVGLHLGGGRDGADLLGSAVSTAQLRMLAASAH